MHSFRVFAITDLLALCWQGFRNIGRQHNFWNKDGRIRLEQAAAFARTSSLVSKEWRGQGAARRGGIHRAAEVDAQRAALREGSISHPHAQHARHAYSGRSREWECLSLHGTSVLSVPSMLQDATTSSSDCSTRKQRLWL